MGVIRRPKDNRTFGEVLLWAGKAAFRQVKPPERPIEVTSQAPQAWFVMLRDEAAAGRVIVPLRPFLKFSRKMDTQLGRLEKRIRRKNPQLGRRGAGSVGRG